MERITVSMRAILLAAGRGRRLDPLGIQGPKCLVPVAGEPLLKRTLQGLTLYGIKDIVVVIGYQKEKIKSLLESEKKFLNGVQIKTVENPNFTQGSILSLWCATDYFDSNLLIMDADVYFDFELLKHLIHSPLKDCFLLDSGFQHTSEEVVLMTRQGRVWNLAKAETLPSNYDLVGETVGFLKLSVKSAVLLKAILKEMVSAGLTGAEYEEAYQRLVQGVPIGFEKTDGFFWMEIDFPEDLKKLQRKLGHYGPKH